MVIRWTVICISLAANEAELISVLGVLSGEMSVVHFVNGLCASLMLKFEDSEFQILILCQMCGLHVYTFFPACLFLLSAEFFA